MAVTTASPRPRATLQVQVAPAATWIVRLHRPGSANAITPQMLAELDAVLDEAERAGTAVLALAGSPEIFCSGMDLAAAGDARRLRGDTPQDLYGGTAGEPFWDLLMRLQTGPLLIVALVEGSAAGGGVGLVAAADVVLASPSSTFALPEALWGLLPCCVAPFLAERIGRRAMLRMALTTTPMDAPEALRLGLADQIVTDPQAALRRLAVRASRVDPGVRARLKVFVASLPGQVEQARGPALTELSAVLESDLVVRNLSRYAERGAFPWES